MRTAKLGFILLASCSSQTTTTIVPSADAGAAQMTCHPAEFSGSYLLHFTQLSGDCLPIADKLSNISPGPLAGEATPPCSGPSPVFTKNGCHANIEYTCKPTGQNGEIITIHYVETLEQITQDGSKLHETVSMDYSSPDRVCSGLYDVTWTRQ